MRVEGPGFAISLATDGVAVAPRPVDVSAVPGAVVVLSRAWQGALRVEVACVRAPVREWAPGLERIVLDAASGKARAAAGLGSLSPAAVVQLGHAWQQNFSGTGEGIRARGRHVLGFVAGDALACTAICSEPAAGDDCDAAAASFAVEAAFGAPPPPTMLLRAALWAGEHPRAALGGGALLVLAGAALLLRFRPRPRRI